VFTSFVPCQNLHLPVVAAAEDAAKGKKLEEGFSDSKTNMG
jgi:hypothetical protein